MRKVIIAVVFGILLAGVITSCTKTETSAETELYGIDNDEVKDEDI